MRRKVFIVSTVTLLACLNPSCTSYTSRVYLGKVLQEYDSSVVRMDRLRPHYLTKAGTLRQDVAFAGLMACSNHDPRHTASSLEQMQELTRRHGCKNWQMYGVLTDDYAYFEKVKNNYADTTFDDAPFHSVVGAIALPPPDLNQND